jgi:hypothetical protein
VPHKGEFYSIILAIGMVSKRKAKKLANRVKGHWKRVFPPTPKPILNGFILPCQEMWLSDLERTEAEEPVVPKQKNTAHRDLHPALAWARGISLFSVLSGGLGIMQPQFFWFSICLVYGGLLLAAADLCFEPSLSKTFKIVGVGAAIVLLIAFSLKIVFVSTPINFATLTTDFNYSPDKAPGGISWRPFFTELDLMVSNPTDGDYDNLDLLVRPDDPVAEIRQLSTLSDVSFEDEFGVTTHLTLEDVGNGPPITLSFLATDAGYKVHCSHLPPHNSLKIVMALVKMNKGRELAPGEKAVIPSGFTLQDFSMREIFTASDGRFTYWFGSIGNEGLYLPKTKPKTVLIKGLYTAANRRKSVDQQVLVQ